MPTLLRILGYRVQIFTNDHRPPHVHVEKTSGPSCVFELNCPRGPLRLRTVKGRMSDRTIARLAELIAPEIERLCREWRNIHG
ncbi:DUF4160 domain-containing protein [Trinickia soli]|uniref:DUF4160 domain-containing protein n=1 Tax=Trinickia soli TaxID=380675 RepID=A0A2N7WCG3_9BURK|nr:hypothetical protein C0Z19_04920 [Trinickia soli]